MTARWLSYPSGQALSSRTGSIHATLAADSFFAAVIPDGQECRLDLPAGLSLHLVNVAMTRPDAAAAVLHVGGDTALAPVATLQPQAGQVSLSTSLAAGACRLAAVGSSLAVTGKVVLLRGHVRGSRALEVDHAEWSALCTQRRQIAEAYAARGLSWEAQAEEQGLPVERGALQLHQQCQRLIKAHALRRGVPVWQPSAPYGGGSGARHEAPLDGWDAWIEATSMPVSPEGLGRVAPSDWPALRALVTDALSPPLTAAHALRLLRAHGQHGHGGGGGADPATTTRGKGGAAPSKPPSKPPSKLSVLVLGAEGFELGGRSKWLELCRAFPSARRVVVIFVGPGVPASLHGKTRAVRPDKAARAAGAAGGGSGGGGGGGSGGGGGVGAGLQRLRLKFVRGVYHEALRGGALPPEARAPQLALALNSGLADFYASWGPTLSALLAARVPLACTSYHAQEAELDVRTLDARLGAHVLLGAEPNPFASELPHLDETFPGRAFAASSFLTLCCGYRVDAVGER